MRIEKEATACPGGGTCEAPTGKGTAARVDHHCREGWRGVALPGVAHPSSPRAALQAWAICEGCSNTNDLHLSVKS